MEGDGRDVEKEPPARVGAVDAVADNRGDETRQEDEVLEFRLTVEHLGGKERRTERGPEDAADSSGDSSHHHNPPVLGSQVQEVGQKRSESGANLRYRTFAASRSSRADRDGRRDRLNHRHPAANLSTQMMKGLDNGVGAVAFRLGSESEDQGSGKEPSDDQGDREEPGDLRGKTRPSLHSAGRRKEMANLDQQEPLGELEDQIEKNGADAGDHSDQGAVENPFRPVPEAGIQEDSERSGQPGLLLSVIPAQ